MLVERALSQRKETLFVQGLTKEKERKSDEELAILSNYRLKRMT